MQILSRAYDNNGEVTIGNVPIALNGMNVNLPENSDSTQQQEILDALPVMVFLERGGRIIFANAEARQMLGVAEGRWIQRPVEEVLWGLFPGTAEPQTALTGSRHGRPFHATLSVKGGRLMPVEGTYSLLNAELHEAVIVAQAGGRERAPKPRLMEDVLASIPEAVAIVHGAHVLYTNAAFTRMFGYTADEVSGGDLRDLIVPETRHHENAMLQRTMDEHGRAALETVRITKHGELVDVAMQVGPLLVGGEKAGEVLTYRDIGERKDVEAKLQHDAMHDGLTGLPNRALFEDRVCLALSRGMRRRDQGCGVLFLDLDHFREINNTLGHAAGDLLLVAFADRLRSILRPQDSAARIGGDEFAILVENILTVLDLDIVATRLLKALERPFEVLGHRFVARASIGVAMAGRDTADVESLLRNSDFAMYRAKERGGQRYEVFDRNMGIQVDSQQERERELRQALSNRKFEIWYKPIYRLATGLLEGFEALLRWRRADGSIDSLGDLLPVAEDTGLSISIGRDTLETVCSQLHDWSRKLPCNPLMLSVNLTHRQFYHADLVPQLKRTLVATGADPSRLMFEISETVINENPDAALAILQRLVDCGVRGALDHFGSSLAPLNHLVRLPIEVVKMDAHLTIATTRTGRQLALVESLIHVGKSVGVQSLAQGIETLEQLNALRRLGCELGQGKLLSETLEPARAERIAGQRHWSLPSNSSGGGS
jgi:diguanylate cyclase (GGDEF)-like protein/PAS domain S-box-containing protein